MINENRNITVAKTLQYYNLCKDLEIEGFNFKVMKRSNPMKYYPILPWRVDLTGTLSKSMIQKAVVGLEYIDGLSETLEEVERVLSGEVESIELYDIVKRDNYTVELIRRYENDEINLKNFSEEVVELVELLRSDS